MKSRVLILAVLLMLALSACDSGELERLRTENEELQTQVSALEEKNTALREKLKELEKPKITESERDDNPIDQFYRSLEVDGCTASMNAQNESWADAWEAEARGLADQLKSHLPLQEDRDLVDGYLNAVEEQVQRGQIMAIYPIADLKLSQEERYLVSGTLRMILIPGQRIRAWRDAFYQLLSFLPEVWDDRFLFDPEAVHLDLP